MAELGRCECGCGRETKIAQRNDRNAGLVKGRPRRFVVGHNNRKSGVDFIEDPETHCWVWQLRISAGYGYAYRPGGEAIGAHRLYYEELVGPIPEGLEPDHLCRNKACCNPGHLEPVTHRENSLRGEGACAVNARKTHCKHGHPFDEENTSVNRHGHRRCLACRKRHNDARKRAA